MGSALKKAVSDNRDGETIVSTLVALIYLMNLSLMVLSNECNPLNKAVQLLSIFSAQKHSFGMVLKENI